MSLKINIGAGKFRKKGWTNIDHRSGHYCVNPIDIDIDFFNQFRFPFESGDVDLAYMSHVTEHLTDDAAQRVFNDAFRVMKSGGVFRITCPDADSAFDALVAGRRDFFRVYDENVIFNDPAWALKYKLICPLKHQDIEQLFLYLICTQRCGAVDA